MSSDGFTTLARLTFIRSGDTVYIINNPLPSWELMLGLTDKITARFDHYRCPFSFLDDFDNWWTWHKRVFADKRSTGSVTCDMVDDLKVLKEFKIDRTMKFRTFDRFSTPIVQRPCVLTHTA